MAKNYQPREVQCYHCRHRFEVGGRAQSTSCPACNKPLIVKDEVIDRMRIGLRELRTCGKIIVKKKGRLAAEHIEAHGGIECDGVIDAKHVVSGQTVRLGPKASYRGDLEAPAVEMAAGAKVAPSLFQVPADPLGLADLGQSTDTKPP